MDSHLHHRPQPLHLQSSDMLTDIVIGLSDGLTVPFALSAGLSAAAAAPQTIIIACGALIAAGSIAMALGSFLTSKSETDHYNSELKKEYDELDRDPLREKEKVKAFFAKLGLSEAVQQQAVEEMVKDNQKWADFMMKYQLGLNKPDPKRARNSAFNIGLSYIIGGIVPLLPYFFTHHVMNALTLSAIFTLTCLFIFGYAKGKITGVNPWAGALRVTLIGAAAAACAFGVAKLIEG